MNNRNGPDEGLAQKGRGSANFSDELPPYMVLGLSSVCNWIACVLCAVTQQQSGLLLQTIVVGQTSKIGLNTNWPTPWPRTFLRDTRMWRWYTDPLIFVGSIRSRNNGSIFRWVLDTFYSIISSTFECWFCRMVIEKCGSLYVHKSVIITLECDLGES